MLSYISEHLGCLQSLATVYNTLHKYLCTYGICIDTAVELVPRIVIAELKVFYSDFSFLYYSCVQHSVNYLLYSKATQSPIYVYTFKKIFSILKFKNI